jgi:hypothetical protein
VTKKTGSYLGGHTLASRSWFGRSSRKPENFNTKAERAAQAKINEAMWGKQQEKSPAEMAEEKRQFELAVEKGRAQFELTREKFRASLSAPLVEKSPAEMAVERKARRHYRPRWFQKNKN